MSAEEAGAERVKTFGRRGVRRILGSILLFLALAAFLVPVTAASVMRDFKPDLVLRFAPWDARARAAVAEQGILRDQSPAGLLRTRAQALEAFNRDSTAHRALTTLGFLANAQGDIPRAASIFQFSETLSRRDPRTELWLIEYAVQRNDVPAALHHYDVALSTSYDVWPLLFTTLATASSQPHIAGQLNALLRRRPLWWRNYLDFALGVTRDPVALAAMTNGLLNPAVEADNSLAQRIIARLIELNRFDLAWSSYARMPGQRAAAALLLRNPSFDQLAGLPPFDWQYATDPGLLSEARPLEGAPGRFALYLPELPSADGVAARQLLRLPPGRYRIRAETGGAVADPASRPSISIACAGAGGRTLLTLPFAPQGGVGSDFPVPAGCGFQWISIQVRQGAEGLAPQPAWISAVAVTPLGA